MENNLKYIIHQNYDTSPRLFGIFSYTSIIISLLIAIPIIYLIYISSFEINIKIYIIVSVTIPLIIINYIFSNSNNIYILLFFILKYVFSRKVYVYDKYLNNISK